MGRIVSQIVNKKGNKRCAEIRADFAQKQHKKVQIYEDLHFSVHKSGRLVHTFQQLSEWPPTKDGAGRNQTHRAGTGGPRPTNAKSQRDRHHELVALALNVGLIALQNEVVFGDGEAKSGAVVLARF